MRNLGGRTEARLGRTVHDCTTFVSARMMAAQGWVVQAMAALGWVVQTMVAQGWVVHATAVLGWVWRWCG